MLNVRFAVRNDADKIVSMIRNNFNSNIIDTTIYCCKGINRFVKEQISATNHFTDTTYIVAEKNGEIIGNVEIKKINNTVFLNYICISQSERHKGYGKIILKEVISMTRENHHEKISLDVFSDNKIAINWYKNLGFITDYFTEYWNIRLIQPKVTPIGNISGYTQGEICHDVYGFSNFTLTTNQGVYSIGSLGDNLYRLTQDILLKDSDALSCLYLLDKKRTILGIFRNDGEQKFYKNAVLFHKSARLTAELCSLDKIIL